MRRFGLAPKNTVTPVSPNGGNASTITNAPLAHMEVEGKYSYSTLSYPLDLQSRVDLGHYMMFYVNIPNQSSYAAKHDKARTDINKKGGAGGALSDNDQQQKAILNGKGYSKDAGAAGNFNKEGQSWKAGETEKVLFREPHKGVFPKMTKRTNDAITLYMPNTGITSQHTPQWAASELGGDIGEAGGKVAAGQQTGMWAQSQGFMAQLAGKMKDMGTDLIGQAAGTSELKAARDKL